METYEKVEKIIKELRKFSIKIISLEPPLKDESLIEKFEKKYFIKLPEDYKFFIRRMNGISMMGDEIYGLHDDKREETLERIYYREHFLVQYPQPQYLIPFAPDGAGNFYCFDIRNMENDDTCPIVFWTSNYAYTDGDTPEIVNSNFVDFVEEVVIGWTLENYDYEGNER